MKKVLLMLLTCGLLFSCKSTKQSSTISSVDSKQNSKVKKRVLSIEDLATFTSAEDFVKYYPDSNPENGTGLFDEGSVERSYTVLYKDTPDEVLITWGKKGEVHDVTIAGNGKWYSKAGIRVGMTYDELVFLNKGPIKVYGFGWDYGGAVDWNKGAMEKSGVLVYVSPEGEIDPKFYGDHIINPTESELQTLNLRVTAIVYYPK